MQRPAAPDTGGGPNRLERALTAFLRFRGDTDSARELLAANDDLRDLLEPLLQPEPEPEDPESVPEVVLGGDFRLEREIGRGGTGVVYAAWQLSLGRRVAVKVLPHHITLTPATVARFRREAKTIAGLCHPGIVRVLMVGSDGDTHWFAMELIDGRSLAERLDELTGAHERPGQWTRQMVGLAAQIADALHHAHGLGVVHRDVKPSNILLRPDGNAVLTDFGLAHEAGAPSLTLPGGRAGTPCYMAPEHISGGRDAVDARSDVFALGATLHEMLTFERAFDAGSPDLSMRRVVNDQPIDASRRNPAVTADLAAVVGKALEKAPSCRYQTAGEFADDLRAYLAHRPVQARRPAALARALRWARRQPGKAAIAGALALCVPIVAALLGFIAARAPLVRAGEEKRLEHLIDQGFHYVAHSHRDYAKAKEVLDEALRLAPENAEVLVATTMMLGRWGEHGYTSALAFLDARSELCARQGELRRARALCLHSLERTAEAQAIEAEIGAPRSALDHYLAGTIARTTAETPAHHVLALHHYSLATRISPRPRMGTVAAFAISADEADDQAAREEAFTALTTLWPDSSRAWGMAAWIMRRADPPRALQASDRALALFPDEGGLLGARSLILENLGDFDAAISTLEHLLRLSPESTDARIALDRLRAARQPHAR